ncbi:hypothetical protein PPERSA_11422 [Pseudocohnilembus persalinus]|uniref:RING-type domain-containing protein n=1 Tax=Pseudocohnilembus persalinus TaxID=266149 RepID=A0A0V0QQI9_PSEPJ|nr:hypothetical protein PPERSA_11422 [Pseudocohnilembus persalinus]|eukprot:KRX04298.1 hypothetical protein PPERSA_11422 [Pseudocohnilembus persalinus]
MEIISDSNIENEKQLKLELLFITEANKQYKDSNILNVQEMKKLLYIYNDLECAICKENLILESLKQKKKTYQTNYQEQLYQEQNKQQLQDDKKKEEIISILCGHYFHWYCLSNYQQTICPLCRYHQQPPQIQFCTSCGESENLWMCLLCGTFHCGFEFDEKSHIRHHYFETQHNFSMEIESKLVFDNYENQYVHRLLQNDFDGKIITSKKNQSKQSDEKIQNVEDILKQYENIMGDQLQSQRKFFEDKLINIKEQFIGMLNNKRNQIDKIEEQIIQEEKDKNALKNKLAISNNELSYEKASFLQTYENQI